MIGPLDIVDPEDTATPQPEGWKPPFAHGAPRSTLEWAREWRCSTERAYLTLYALRRKGLAAWRGMRGPYRLWITTETMEKT